ncbi:hypothetical protein HT031_005863 [Scenedesmus sp. PABB004]|nr:hypothetical protein HT031_005863 [Scenedesmus sp. PABB004]
MQTLLSNQRAAGIAPGARAGARKAGVARAAVQTPAAPATTNGVARAKPGVPEGTPIVTPQDLASRPRRNRRSETFRRGVRESWLSPAHFILPIFVHEGASNEPIASMPGISRLAYGKSVVDHVAEARSLGVNQVVIFPKTPDALKTPTAEEAFNPNGLSQRTIRLLKDAFPDVEIYTDVALDPYNSDGHDGIVRDDGVIMNDETVEYLCRQAVSQAEAGADCVSPSDMMDGRVGAIRRALDSAGHTQVSIMSYTAKYASAFYGPFRDALASAPKAGAAHRRIPPNKKEYQMDPANYREALREAAADEAEGADIMMVKPGMPYLDVVRSLRDNTSLPISVYHVSGEYAMLKAAAERGWLNERDAALEALMCFRRAGADLILTYYSIEAAKWLAAENDQGALAMAPPLAALLLAAALLLSTAASGAVVQLDVCQASGDAASPHASQLTVRDGVCTVSSLLLSSAGGGASCAASASGEALVMAFPCSPRASGDARVPIGPALNLWAEHPAGPASGAPPAPGLGIAALSCNLTTLNPALYFHRSAAPLYLYGYAVTGVPCARTSAEQFAAGVAARGDAAASPYGMWLVPQLPAVRRAAPRLARARGRCPPPPLAAAPPPLTPFPSWPPPPPPPPLLQPPKAFDTAQQACHLVVTRSGASFVSDVTFPRAFPFPCLLHEELEDELQANDARGGSSDADEDDDVFDGLDEAMSSLRARSSFRKFPASTLGAGGQPLVDYELHPQHRKDGKESLPIPEAGAGGSSYRSNFITPAVMGSLPRGLTQTERASLGTPLGMSPALARLAETPGGGRAASQSARCGPLRGAVVAFVTAGYSGKRFVFEKAKELGVRAVIIDGPDSWSQTLVGEGVAEEFVPLDFADAGTVFDRALAALSALREAKGRLDGVTTFNEFAVPLVARLAERLGLPGNPPAACDLARDKGATRRLMDAAGLPSPKHALITSEAELEAAAALVGFPAVIKPIAAAASMGVVRVDDLPALRAKVADVQRQLARLFLDEHGHLREGEDGAALDPAERAKVSQFVSSTIMMEEYLDGDEVDCDLVFSGGECNYGAVTDNWPTVEPYFNETGSNCPSILPVAAQKELLDLAVASVQVLGFKLGVFHVELKMTSRGPRLIEVNARMGGGGVRDINLVVWGVDLVVEHLLASCGLPAAPLIARRPLVRLAEYSINAPATGIIEHADFLEPWAELPGTIYARALVAPGDKVVCVADGMPSWVCEICVERPTVRQAINFVKQVEREIDFPISPLVAK